ncbi:putative beta-lactamase HcpC precursor [compost metagenome]
MKSRRLALITAVSLLACLPGPLAPPVLAAENALLRYQRSQFQERLIQANAGEAYEQYLVGTEYVRGELVPKDLKQAIAWFEKAAAQGEEAARVALGLMFRDGEGVAQDYRKAKKLLETAAARGNVDAQVNLANLYSRGLGTKPDQVAAFGWYMKAAKQGHREAQCIVGTRYLEGKGVEADDQEAFKWFKLSSEQGFAVSHNNLGSMYAHGRGVKKDLLEAYFYFRLGMETLPVAEENFQRIARSLSAEQRERVEQRAEEWLEEQDDPEWAWERYTKSPRFIEDKRGELERLRAKARKGNLDAMAQLGHELHYAPDELQNDREAIDWLLKAANQGSTDAAFKLGRSLGKSLGGQLGYTPKDAFQWTLQAAKQGSRSACVDLAVNYQDGSGVEREPQQAVHWYTVAMKRGLVGCGFDLSKLFTKEGAVGENQVERLKWFLVPIYVFSGRSPGYLANNRHLQVMLGEMRASMMAEQILEAEAAARQWIADNPFKPDADIQ